MGLVWGFFTLNLIIHSPTSIYQAPGVDKAVGCSHKLDEAPAHMEFTF